MICALEAGCVWLVEMLSHSVLLGVNSQLHAQLWLEIGHVGLGKYKPGWVNGFVDYLDLRE